MCDLDKSDYHRMWHVKNQSLNHAEVPQPNVTLHFMLPYYVCQRQWRICYERDTSAEFEFLSNNFCITAEHATKWSQQMHCTVRQNKTSPASMCCCTYVCNNNNKSTKEKMAPLFFRIPLKYWICVQYRIPNWQIYYIFFRTLLSIWSNFLWMHLFQIIERYISLKKKEETLTSHTHPFFPIRTSTF